MRRACEKTTGTRLVPSMLYDRFTKPLAELFRTVVGVLLEREGEARSLPFWGVAIADPADPCAPLLWPEG